MTNTEAMHAEFDAIEAATDAAAAILEKDHNNAEAKAEMLRQFALYDAWLARHTGIVYRY